MTSAPGQGFAQDLTFNINVQITDSILKRPACITRREPVLACVLEELLVNREPTYL